MQAWLSITPKDSDIPNSKAYGIGLPVLPFHVLHLPEFLDELGYARNTGMGFSGITYNEIESWARMTFTDLTAFESLAIFKMAEAFASVAGNKDSECPIQSDDIRNRTNETNAANISSIGKRR